jgi:hypothetical protein
LASNGASPIENEEKRRKMIKWGIIGAVGLIIVILAIVLPLTLGGGGDNPGPKPPPSPVGPTPLPSGLMNPYSTDNKATYSSPSGTLLYG